LQFVIVVSKVTTKKTKTMNATCVLVSDVVTMWKKPPPWTNTCRGGFECCNTLKKARTICHPGLESTHNEKKTRTTSSSLSSWFRNLHKATKIKLKIYRLHEKKTITLKVAFWNHGKFLALHLTSCFLNLKLN